MKLKHFPKKLLAGWGIYLILSFYAALGQAETPWGWDFAAYEKAADAIYHGQPIYTNTVHQDSPYLYPPLLAILLLPIVIPFSTGITAFIWFCVNIALTILTLQMLLPASDPTRNTIWILPIFFTPMFLTLFLGQASILMMTLLVGVWRLSFQKGQPYWAGLCLATAIWFKLYPLVFLPYFLIKRQWKVVASATLSSLLLGGFQLIFAGMSNFEAYFTHILPNLSEQGQPELVKHNLSIFGVATRLFTNTDYTTPLIESQVLFNSFRLVVPILLGISLAYLLLKKQSHHDFSLMMMLAPLLGSTLWLHGYIAWLMPIIVVWMTAQTHQQALKRLCIVAYLMITLHLPIIIAVDVLDWQNSPLTQVITSLPFFATLLLWGMIVRLIS